MRHPDDQPSIGIILCGSRNEIIVEYALRDSSKPMGVAQYRLSETLPERLRHDSPAVKDLQQEFQSAAAIELFDEVESTLRDVTAAYDIPAERPVALRSLLRKLKQLGKAPPSTNRFLAAWKAREAAASGVYSPAVANTVRVSQLLLSELNGPATHA